MHHPPTFSNTVPALRQIAATRERYEPIDLSLLNAYAKRRIGGKTVYFGNIGTNSRTLVDYLVRNGAPDISDEANPAEYMLETIGAAPGVSSSIDWPAVWRSSDEYKGVQAELHSLADTSRPARELTEEDYDEFAAPFSDQLRYATERTFQQYWRSPAYINSKALLTIGTVSLRGSHSGKECVLIIIPVFAYRLLLLHV